MAGKNWYLEAQKVYDREPCRRNFHEDLFWHYVNGYVVSCPDFFVMARIVDSSKPLHMLVDPTRRWENGDCWWIHCFAGDVLKIFTWCPIELGVTGWERNNVPRLYNLNLIRKRLTHVKKRMDRDSVE
jgi:hypothetical protein